MSRFHEYLESVLNEEHLEIWEFDGIMIDLYKNPKTISKMMTWMRGVIDNNGNLYVADLSENNDSVTFDNSVIHCDIVERLRKLGELKGPSYEEGEDPGNYVTYWITVDRQASSNNFILAESYDEDFLDDPFIQEAVFDKIDKCKEKNPWFNFKENFNE